MKTCDLPLPEGVQAFFSETTQECAGQLALHVAEILHGRLRRGGRASLVVSGGSTPVPFFQTLAQQELAWARVTMLLADERWVPEGDPASNTTLVRQNLLARLARRCTAAGAG